MGQSRMSDIIKTSLEGIKSFTDMDTVTGQAINTPSGVTVIPISKITVGFATGGLDLPTKKAVADQSFGGGGGTGISITPVAFLTVNKNAEINLINLKDETGRGVERVVSLIENTPDLIEKIKGALT